MATQNVYFTTPATIQRDQNVQGTTSVMDTAQTLVGIKTFCDGGPANVPYYGCPPIYATGQYNTGPTSLLTALNIARVGTGASTDGYGQNTKGMCVLIGNAWSGQEVYYTTGAATYYGTGYSYDQALMQVASVGKFVNSFCFLQMLEKRMIAGTDTYYTLSNDPAWTGSYWYYNSGTGGLMSNEAIATGVANFTAGGNVQGLDWTGTRASGNLNEFTFLNCMSLNIGFSNPLIVAPANIIGTSSWLCTGGSQAGADWAINMHNRDIYNAVISGVTDGSPAAAFANPASLWGTTVARQANNNTYITGPNADYLATCIKVIKNGFVPLAYRVAGMTGTTSGFKINEQRATYGALNYTLMGAMCNFGAKRAGYTNLLDYVQQNIFTPMEISTPKDCYIANIQNPPTNTDRFAVGQLGRRTKQMSSGTNLCGWGVPVSAEGGALYQAGLDWEANPATGKKWNTLYWAPQEVQDTMISLTTSSYNDEYWSFSSNVVCTAAVLSKMYRTFINRGVYTNSSGQEVRLLKRRTWNYSLSTCVSPGAQFYQYNETPTYLYTFARWIVAQFLTYSTDNPFSDVTFSGTDFSGATNVTSSNAYTSSTLGTWGGASGGHYCLDWSTGYYVFMWGALNTFTNVAKGLNAPGFLNMIAETF